MTHCNYYELTASNSFELGRLTGELFRNQLQQLLRYSQAERGWHNRILNAQAYLKPTIDNFPSIYEEIKGYSEGANIPIAEFWTLLIED